MSDEATGNLRRPTGRTGRLAFALLAAPAVAGLLSAAALARPSIVLQVTAEPDFGTPGTRITFTYVVTNTGDVPILDVAVADDRFGSVGSAPRLDPGSSVSFTRTEVLGASPVKLRADATGRAEPGGRVRARDVATVTVILEEDAGAGTGPGTLAFTGLGSGPAAGAGLLLLVLGGGLLAAGRRR